MRLTIPLVLKNIKVHPYNTSQEKDLILIPIYQEKIDDSCLDIALDICNIPQNIIDELSLDEKKYLLYKLREISVGTDINVKFQCSYCKTANINSGDIKCEIIKPKKHSPYIIDLCTNPTPENIDEFFTNIDELDLDEYEELKSNINDYITSFTFELPVYCQKCGKINYIDITDTNFVLKAMSTESLGSMYNTYTNLTYFGHYTKLDIDSMYPFERTFLITNLNKLKEKENANIKQ